MCRSLVRHVWIIGLGLVFTAGVAAGQVAPLPFQNTIAWGSPIQPDIDRGDRSQTAMQSDVSATVPVENSVDAPNQTANDASVASTSSVPANNPAPVSLDNTVQQLGTPFPLQLQPQGLKIGPFYMTSVSDSFFVAVNSVPGEPTATAVGDSVGATLVYTKTLSKGVLAVQAKEQFSVSHAHPYFNQAIGVNFNDQLTTRWSVNASLQFVYFQNSILANPQYLLNYQNAGTVQQTAFVPQTGYTLYETNSISFSYALSGRTHLTLSPILGATFLDNEGVWSSTHQFGGAVAVSRDFTPDLSLGAYYSLAHSVTSGVTGSPSWNSQGIGLSFAYKFLQSWSLAGNLGASGQLQAQVWTLTPTGSVRLMKAFREASISAGYTRSEANNVFVSSGYYDQGDVGYNQKVGQKVSVNAGVGMFRTSNTGNYTNGKRVGGSVVYQWSPRLSMNMGYNFAHQTGLQTSSFSPFLGNTSYFSVGLNWFLGARSEL